MLLLDSGCSGPILKQNFVQDHAVPWIRRGSPIAVNAADQGRTPVFDTLRTSCFALAPTKKNSHGRYRASRKGLPVIYLCRGYSATARMSSGIREKLFWRSQYCKTHYLPVDMSVQNATHSFIRMLQEGRNG